MRALDSTAEHSSDLEEWVSEASIWLAIDNECADETKAMGEAMEISLVEAEERKAAENPLTEREGKEIIEKFPESELLLTLDGILSLERLVELIDKGALEMKSKLVDYLLLEQRCKRWYSCSKAYFSEAAKALKDSIVEAKDQESEQERPRKRSAGSKKSSSLREDDEEGEDCVPAIVLSFVEERVRALQAAVYLSRPDGDKEAVPSIFAAYTREEVELLDD